MITPAYCALMARYAQWMNSRLHAAIAAVHFFNHGTHHRGQLTTLMFQAGIDPGVTDLPWVLRDATTR